MQGVGFGVFGVVGFRASRVSGVQRLGFLGVLEVWGFGGLGGFGVRVVCLGSRARKRQNFSCRPTSLRPPLCVPRRQLQGLGYALGQTAKGPPPLPKVGNPISPQSF